MGVSVGKTAKQKTGARADREQRLAAELRANLKRRKAKSRDAQAGLEPTVKVKKQPD